MIEQRFTSPDWPSPPGDPTLVDLLRRRFAQAPDRIIYTLLDDDFFDSGIVSGPTLSYRQLDTHARSIAHHLASLGHMGDRVLLLFAPGLEFMPAFFACLYAGMIPVPVFPPTRGLEADPLTAVRRIVHDCSPVAILIGGEHAQEIQRLCAADTHLNSRHWLNIEQVDMVSADQWQRPDIDSHSTALLQYTSGSTGSPRGVMVSHANILANEYIIQLAFNHMTHARPGVGVCWLPFQHDMGLMGSVLQAVFVDGPCYFMSPLQFLRKPIRWLQAMSHLAPQTAYSSGGPNFAYELCVRKLKPEHLIDLDLSHWEVAYVGSEHVSPQTLKRFSAAFAPCGFNPNAFYPCYGLAEATLYVTGGHYLQPPIIRTFIEHQGRMIRDTHTGVYTGTQPLVETAAIDDRRTTAASLDTIAGAAAVTEQTSRRLVGCGRPWLQDEVIIVDPESCRQCPPGTIGEIWVSGSGVAQGYWNRPQETQQTFAAYTQPQRRGPFLRTGDLGFFDDGELFISGRLKDLIIIRGRNYFPEDIEATVQKLHTAFAAVSTVALGHQAGGEERLVILQEIDRGNRRFDPTQLATLIRQTIAEEHQLNTHDIRFLRKGMLPKTTSGKLRRFAAHERYAAGQLLEWTDPQTS